MVLADIQKREIADCLEAEMRCFYNRQTGEIKSIIDFEIWYDADKEPWLEDINEIEEHIEDYFAFDNMSSSDSFKIMADFVDNIVDSQIQSKLLNALNKPKPFSHFKSAVDDSGEYRMQWFDYKKSRYLDWVQRQIDLENRIVKLDGISDEFH